MKTTPIIPRMWTAMLPKDAPRLGYGPDRNMRLLSPSFWESILPVGSILYVRHDNSGPRPFTRVYTEPEYAAYWRRKLVEALEVLGVPFQMALDTRTPFPQDLESFADIAFSLHSGEYQLVAAVYQMLLGNMSEADYSVAALVCHEDKAKPISELMLLPANYSVYRQRDMLLRIAFAFYYKLPVASETVTLLIGQLNASNELHNFHKIRF